MVKEKEFHAQGLIKIYFRSKTFHRYLIGIMTFLLIFIIVVDGASPKKYRLQINELSDYDIVATRDIVNTIKTEKNRKDAEKKVPNVMTKDIKVSSNTLDNWVEFVLDIEKSRKTTATKISALDKGALSTKEIESSITQIEQNEAVALNTELNKIGVNLTNDLLVFLVSEKRCEDIDLDRFKSIVKEHINVVIAGDIKKEDISQRVADIDKSLKNSTIPNELKFIGNALIAAIVKPNWVVDEVATLRNKKEAYDRVDNIELIAKGTKIIAYGEKVTDEKYKILEDLNLLETSSRFDIVFVLVVFILMGFLSLFLILYMRHFCRRSLYSRKDIAIICIAMFLIVIIARGIFEISPSYAPMAVPICIAAMLISILLDLKLAIMVNIVLTITVSLFIKGDITFIYMSILSGTLSAYFVSKSTQRNRLSMAGVLIGIFNAIIILCFGIINKSDWNVILKQGAIAFINGIGSMILTVGILPFLESIFNIVTPIKLMELANPNSPLIKRLLLEAPGTYHHSLMVGNLAEVATETIGGNSLLARVGAYYHDVGKLTRPHFFSENQLGENPHDKITANLSTLIITSHLNDGVEIAEKYKLPQIITDIIRQHHGNTLVAYFYHKAKNVEKAEDVKPENFRYQGPRPTTKESAVVMLADSVEAAVRSLSDKTEGKIEGLIRKIIKDKLDDGQLDLCNLTLRDMDMIARAFMRVLSGFFHAREKYPELKSNKK